MPVVTAAVTALIDKLPVSLFTQLNEYAADMVRERRVRRLVAILEKVDVLASERGLSEEQMHKLADHVGLPWLEKATLHDDADLQAAWANLFVAITTDSDAALNATYVSILDGLNSMDCKVLEHIVSNGIVQDEEQELVLTPLADEEICRAMSDNSYGIDKIQISIENLVRQGCLVRSSPAPMKPELSVYGGLLQVISATALGINFYSAASGVDLSSIAPVLNPEQLRDRLGVVDVTSRSRTGAAVVLASSIRAGL